MPRIEVIRDTTGERRAWFTCPGCGLNHAPVVEKGTNQAPVWGWNGDVDRPTFTPSILVRTTKLTEAGMAAFDRGEKPGPDGSYEHVNVVCHSFVTDGRIQFLGDCTHAFAGQTVDLPEVEA